ncbi:LCP family protein [Actinomycetospora cinnamomea]|uniref:LCP family protein n=1 Tax=Actinomycetospora cinnamomea TaxID=663609 RepID=UPI001403ACAF|nr:LCP family protein [Actinomycetospora cinnamomea]
MPATVIARPVEEAPEQPAPEEPAGPDAPGAPEPGELPGVEPRRATEARVDQTEWAATSAVLASLGARLATWRRRWPWPRTLRLLTATCAVLVLVVCGLGWGAASWVEAAVRQIGALDPDSPAIQDAASQVGDQNFLVVGSDSRAGAAAEDAGDTADVPGARTDTIMVVHVPEDRSAVTVVSFPRDLEITRPACERWDPVSGAYSPQVLPPAPRVKLNTAYAAGGPRCVTRAVQELSGLAVNRFLGVDFHGFEGMVDAVHGVPICVERPVTDSVLGPIVPQAGPTVLTGRQALDFVRARHVEGDPSSDYGRIQRQQRFLGALLRSVLSAGTLLDPGRLEGLVEAVSRSTFGENVGSDQLLALSQSLGSLDPRTVTFVTVPTTGVPNERGNEVLRRGEERALFSALIDDRPLPGAGGPVPAAPAPVDVRLVDARSPAGESADDGDGSSDGSSSDDGGRGSSDDRSSDDGTDDDDDGDDGEALRFAAPAADGPSTGAVAERLRTAGFGVVTDRGRTTGTGSATTIRYSPDQAAAASALSSAVPDAALDPTATVPGTLVLTLGDDFDGTVRSGAAPSGAGANAPVNPAITAADASCT